MDASAENRRKWRILCLGNDVLCDDAVGFVIGEELARRRLDAVEVVKSSESGLRLIDYLVDVDRVMVIDSIQTGQGPPGSIYTFRRDDVVAASATSPHYMGVFEALDLARHLGLRAADDVVIIAVETADCLTIGGEMDSRVKDAVPCVVHEVCDRVMAPI